MHLTSLLPLTAFQGLLGEILHEFFTSLHILRVEALTSFALNCLFKDIAIAHSLGRHG